MFTTTLIALLTSTQALARTLAADGSCGEGVQKICYGVSGGESQNLDPDDVQYVAEYLRFLSDQNKGADKFWNMPKGLDCPEWGLPVPDSGTVLALAKHNNGRLSTSILYADLAAAIDKTADNLKSCGKNGGQIGVVPNKNNPLYSTDDYKKSGVTPDGIVLKLVKAPPK